MVAVRAKIPLLLLCEESYCVPTDREWMAVDAAEMLVVITWYVP